MHLTETNAASFWSLAAIAATALVLALVILIDRLREPHRDPTGIVAVVDLRTARRALARVDRIDRTSVTAGAAAYRHLMSVRTWVAGERHVGNARRRARMADLFDDVTAQLTDLNTHTAPAGITEPVDGPKAGPGRYAPNREVTPVSGPNHD